MPRDAEQPEPRAAKGPMGRVTGLLHALSIDALRELIRLDAGTGRLYWRRREAGWFRDGPKQTAAHKSTAWNARFADTPALATVDGNGYLVGDIFARKYLAHRVVFALANGRWPAGQIDHKDGDRTKWQAQGRDRAGVQHYLGRFDDETAAAKAYDEFVVEHHGEFARLNFPESAA